MGHKIEWHDHGREPTSEPDPGFPEGRDVGLVDPPADLKTCTIKLPYPAKRCGIYIVTCDVCGLSVGITTAGRPDDPRSATFPCTIIDLKKRH